MMASAHTRKHCRTAVMILGVLATLFMPAAADDFKHGWDHSVCNAYTASAHKKPDLPDSFSLRVEVNMLQKNKTSALEEFYDYNDNIGAVHQMEDGSESYYYYYYKSNQYLILTADGNGGYSCFSQDLATNDNNEMFGMSVGKDGSDHIYSVQGALHFGGPDIIDMYLGQETVRGLPCDKWLSCQYWQGIDATANVTWYFSNATQWKTVSAFAEPVRCVVEGVMWVNQSYSQKFSHQYEFYNFQPDMQATDPMFEVPPNTYCVSEKHTKPLPTMPPAYSFSAEFLDANLEAIGFVKEIYDSNAKIAREDFRDPPQFNNPNGTHYMSQIDDFNTGVSYVLDVLSGACSVGQIPQGSVDAASASLKYVRMRSPNDFLALNRSYQYQGTRNIRGIDCDAWAVERFDFPDPQSQSNPASTWTWYFASTDWMSAMGYRDNLVLPVMLEIFSDDSDNPQSYIHKMMQIYEFNAEEPDFAEYDISSCYDPSTSKNAAFLVQGSFSSVVTPSLKVFKSYVRRSLQQTLGVSPLRISRLDVQEAGSNVLVTFDLLDKAPFAGNVANPPVEKNVAEAYSILTDALNRRTLVITLGSDIRRLVAQPPGTEYRFRTFQPNTTPPSVPSGTSSSTPSGTFSSIHSQASSSGYSGGVMGGVAVAMLVLGTLLGFAVVVVVFRLRPRWAARGATSDTSSQNLHSNE